MPKISQDQLRNNVEVVTTNWFINRCPLASRVPRLPIGSTTFAMINRRSATKNDGVTQFCQTWQHPVPLKTHTESPNMPFDQGKMDALQNLMDDIEETSYYGVGSDPAVSSVPKQKGLRTLIKTNRTLEPQNASAYRPADLIRDTLDRCRDGDPDVLLVSTNFITGFAIWGQAIQRLNAGSNVFGTPIDIYETPFLGGVSIIEAPLLKPGTVICLSSSEVRLRMKRRETWVANSRGEFVAEGAVEIDNEHHHAWVEGVKAFHY